MQNIFVYGTLLFSEITKKLTGKSFKTYPAVLSGYKIYSLKNRDYPAIIRQDGSSATGLMIENVDDLSLDIIAYYEGEEYEKKRVTVLLNNKPKDVWTFVWAREIDLFENQDWNNHYFKKNSLQYYLRVLIPDTLEAYNKK